MPKIRGVKPDYWTDEDIVELSIPARLLFIGLWNFACDNGHLQDKSKQIKMRILPTDDVNCAELLREIHAQGLIERTDGWITVPNLAHHQKPHKRWWVTCEKPGCVIPEGASYGFSKPDTTVEQPLNNRDQPLNNGGSTADGDCDVDVDVDCEVDGDVDKPAARTSRKRPHTALPQTWKPTAEHLTRALNAGLVLAAEVEKFKLHAETNDRRAANWNAAFTQWLIKGAEYAEQNKPARPTYVLPHVSQIEQPPNFLSPAEVTAWEAERRAAR